MSMSSAFARSQRAIRGALAAAALALGALLFGSHAGHAVTFDFEYFPDSAGCSVPTPVSQGPHDCDPDWADGFEGGYNTLHEHTVDGMTLTLQTTSRSDGVDWGWLGGVISCGNQPDCSSYLADFSIALTAIQVDLIGVQNTCGCGEEFPDPLTYYLQAYSGPERTGTLLGEMIADASLGPATLSVTAPAGDSIRSITFGATTVDNGECGGDCTNLGIADNLIATVPEPGTAALLGLGIAVLAVRRRRFA